MRASRFAISIGRKVSPSVLSASYVVPNVCRFNCYSKTNLNRLQPSYRFDNPRAEIGYSIRAISGTTADPVTPPRNSNDRDDPEKWEIKMLYDGDCPLCMREVNMLRERNKEYRSIKFVDVGADDYSPEENHGIDYRTAMGRIHAILSDGTIVTDVEAFRRLYEAVGLGWVYAITKYEPVAKVANVVYGIWAKYRMELTGRPPLEEVIEAKMKKKKKGDVCGNVNCKV